METALWSTCIFSVIAVSLSQEYFGVPAFQYQHGNGFFQQPPSYQPNYPPHFRPLGFPQEYQTPYKPFNYQPVYQNEPSPFTNDLSVRSQLPNPYYSDFPNFYQPFPQPQLDDPYQDLNEYNKIPSFRDPIQIIPSRFPPRVENFVERIQNRFSVYNPIGPAIPHGATAFIFIPADANNSTTAAPAVDMNQTPKSTPSSTEVSPTEDPLKNRVGLDENSTETTEANTDDMATTVANSGEQDDLNTEREETTEESSTDSSTVTADVS